MTCRTQSNTFHESEDLNIRAFKDQNNKNIPDQVRVRETERSSHARQRKLHSYVLTFKAADDYPINSPNVIAAHIRTRLLARAEPSLSLFDISAKRARGFSSCVSHTPRA